MFFVFCSPRGKRDTEETNKNAFVHLEAAQSSLITMSTEATDEMSNCDLQRTVNIDLECTEELLQKRSDRNRAEAKRKRKNNKRNNFFGGVSGFYCKYFQR